MTKAITFKETAFLIVQQKGRCYDILCADCPLIVASCAPDIPTDKVYDTIRYKLIIQWLVDNGYKDDIMELLI